MTASQTLSSHDWRGGEEQQLTMVKTAKMELLRALVSECLSAAAEEILKIVEGTILEYEEEMSCSKWVVDSHRRLLDAAKSHSEDSLQMCVTDVKPRSQQPPASVDVSMCWEEEPGNSTSEPTDDMNPESPDTDQEIQIDIDDDVKQERDLNLPLRKAKKIFKCPICLSVFSSKKTMVRHVKRHPEDTSLSYRCQFCERYFYHKSDFIIHTRIHKDSKPYKCKDCEKSFDQRDSLLLHKREHVEQGSHWRLMETPTLDLHAENQHRTGTAGRTLEEELDSIQGEAGGMKTFPLTVTPYDKSEFEQESLQPLCLYQIQTVADIDQDSSATVPVHHIKTEPDVGASDTAADRQLLPSTNSGDQAESVRNITHRRASEKPAELMVQFEAGTTQKPYKCPCCSKCFSLTKTLIRHIKIHSEDKPYQCRFCGRNFCQKSDLVNHTRIHTGERPYECQRCHKSFAQKGNLVVHMRKHTGEKPYQCRECSCCFSQKSSLDCHTQSHRL